MLNVVPKRINTVDRGSSVADDALKAIGMAKVNLLSYHLYHNCDGDGDSEVDCDGVLAMW